jgi:preprotein translocase subunit Sss1
MNEKLTVEKAEQELADLKKKLEKGRRLWRLFVGGVFIIAALILLTSLKPSPKLFISVAVIIAIGLLAIFNILKVELDFRVDEAARKIYERINYLEGFIDAHQKKEIKD